MGGMKDLWMQRASESNEAAAAAMEAAMNGKAYPSAPGWKDPGISKENATRITESSNIRLAQVRQQFEQGFTGTADELAEWMGWSPFTMRPLCTRLRQLNVIERTPERRRGAGGGTAAVLRLKRNTMTAA
jgi:hypothetical protein